MYSEQIASLYGGMGCLFMHLAPVSWQNVQLILISINLLRQQRQQNAVQPSRMDITNVDRTLAALCGGHANAAAQNKLLTIRYDRIIVVITTHLVEPNREGLRQRFCVRIE